MTSNEVKNKIQEKLTTKLNADHVSIEDISNDCGLRFNVSVVSNEFEGKKLLERQRLVNSILEDEMKIIHALSQKTMTPKEWKEKEQKM